MRVSDALLALTARRRELKPTEFFLLTELVFLGNGEVEVPCSSRQLERTTHLSRRLVQRLIDRLTDKARGILEVERGTGADTPSVFRLKFLPGSSTPPGVKTSPPEDKLSSPLATNGRHLGRQTDATPGVKPTPPLNKERVRAQPAGLLPGESWVLESVQTNLGLKIYDPKLKAELAALPNAFGMCELSVCRWLQTKYDEWHSRRVNVRSPALVLKAANEELYAWGMSERFDRLEADRRTEEAERAQPKQPEVPHIPVLSAEEIRSEIAALAIAKRMR